MMKKILMSLLTILMLASIMTPLSAEGSREFFFNYYPDVDYDDQNHTWAYIPKGQSITNAEELEVFGMDLAEYDGVTGPFLLLNGFNEAFTNESGIAVPANTTIYLKGQNYIYVNQTTNTLSLGVIRSNFNVQGTSNDTCTFTSDGSEETFIEVTVTDSKK